MLIELITKMPFPRRPTCGHTCGRGKAIILIFLLYRSYVKRRLPCFQCTVIMFSPLGDGCSQFLFVSFFRVYVFQ